MPAKKAVARAKAAPPVKRATKAVADEKVAAERCSDLADLALPLKKRRAAPVSVGTPSLQVCLAQGKWPDGAPIGRKVQYTPILQKEYADGIRAGSKTYEGRPFRGFVCPKNKDYKLAIFKDDYIIFQVKETRELLRVRVVEEVRCYPAPHGFQDMIADVGIQALLPGFKGNEREAAELYRGFSNTNGLFADLEKLYGAAAIPVQFVDE